MARRVTGGRARTAEDGDDALAGAVGRTRRLGAHQKRVVLRLRRSDVGSSSESVPWVTETVCFFFNAQGEVLRAHRAGDEKLKPAVMRSSGDPIQEQAEQDQDPIAIRSFGAKDAIEKERVTLWLGDLDASVEVVGLMVTYTTDQIARRPHLNAFDATVDVTAEIDDTEDQDVRVSSFIPRETAPAHEFAYTHDRPTESGANYVVLCKMYRDTDSRNDWIFHGIGAKGEVRSSVNAALAEAMQVFLLDIIPEIEIAHRNALNTVASICAALNRNEVLEIEQYFREEGVRREEFAKLLLRVLLMTRPELHRLSRVTALVALLFEMFEQIDINGDGAVDWEEFTTFCVSLGLIATKDQQLQGTASASHSYHQQLVGPHNRSFPYQIRCIRPFPLLRIVSVIQNKCSIVLMYDTDMNFLYEFNHVSRLCHEDNEALAILDVDYIPMRNWMVVSSSDHSLTFWSVVNATSGAFVFAFKIGSRCPIPHIQWCGSALCRLFTISSEGVQLWDVEAKRVASRMTHHQDRITGCLEIPGEEPFLVTCSFDATIAVLHVPSLALAFHLRGHIQGVQQMDYHQRGGLLLSSGFEHQAYCWSIAGQCLRTTLGGHQASLIGARFASSPMDASSVMVVVGDERGHFRLWDISRCVGGHSTDLATPLQSFDIVTPNLCRFRTFACVAPPQGKKKHGASLDLVDIVSGSFRLFRFHAMTHNDESAPPRHVTFNSVSNSFVGSVDGVITVWAGNSGVKLEEPITIRDSDVCAVVFDLPRERKLFVATSDGAIRLYNPITAMMLTKTVVHDGLISSLIYCSRSACVISTGYDRRISIAHSSTGKTDIDILRSVENAHDTCITATAYSPNLELIATGDDGGNIHVYDFQRLYLLFECEGHLDEIRALHFHYSAPTLFSGDASGVVFVWHVATTDTTYQVQPTMRLNLACSNFFVTEYRPSSVSGSRSSRPTTAVKQPAVIVPSPVTTIVCTPESKHATSSYVYVGTVNGAIWGWDFRALTNHARKFGVGKGFEYRFQGTHGLETGSKYNALLRVTHKTSVLKLRPEDVAAPAASSLGRSGKMVGRGLGLDVLESCEASCVWQAHSSMVTQLRELPYPGQIYSVSMDGTIKVWDTTHTCLGTITTIADSHRSQETTPQGPATSANTPGSSSTWKYAYHHHMVNDVRDQHVRIGREMIQRVKRRIRKEQDRRPGSQFFTHHSHEEQHQDEPELAVIQAETPELTPVLVAAEKLLAGQFPFSKESRRLGMQKGFYGAEEARVLRELSQGPRKQHEKQVKSRLAPLMLASPKPEGQAKKFSTRPHGNEHELPVMRTMKNFPVEIERRRATERHAPAHTKPPDLSLSPFLREKLSYGAAPKSTPKKRLPSQAISLQMDASVVVMENVGLPLLQRNQSQPLILDPEISSLRDESQPANESQRRLASIASAPCLPVRRHSSGVSTGITPPSASSPSLDVIDDQSPERDASRMNNIERKMRLYEGLGAARTAPKVDGSSDDTATEVSSRKVASRQQLSPHRQKSQPLLSVRQRAAAEANRLNSSKTSKRLSQGEVVATTTAVGSSLSNPYGPHYTTKQVVDFSGIISRFDSDCSGDIDKSEWVRMMQSCKPIFGAADLEAAERLFHSIDRDDSGKISLEEILPMVFSKATPDQLQKMRQSIQTRIDAAAAAMATGKASNM